MVLPAVAVRVRALQSRFPLAGAAIERLKAIVFVADSIAAAVIFLAWLGTVGVWHKLRWRPRTAAAPTAAICFLSQEGFTVAPTRIRSYFFAERVAALGHRTEVFAFWDHIFRFDHLPDRPIFGVERALVAIKAIEHLLAEPPAVIIEQRPNYELLVTWTMNWLRGTPVVFDVDDWIGDYMWFYPVRVARVLRHCGTLASTCIVSSGRLERELSPFFRRTVKIPTFVDCDVFRPRDGGPNPKEVVFGWNGTLFQEFMYEALVVMIEAFARASDRLAGTVPVVMEIAGTGDYYQQIEKLLASEYSRYNFRLRGWLDPRKMADYLDGIDVGLYSLKLTEKRRGTEEEVFIVSKSPTKVFEYMAKGLPTISTRVGEVAAFIEPGVTGYCSDDVDELCGFFVALAQNQELRQHMGETARQRCVERYSMDAAARMLVEAVADSLPGLQHGSEAGAGRERHT